MAPPHAAKPADFEPLDWYLDEPSTALTDWEARELAADVDFLAVPVRARADGWTPVKQAAFLGWLSDLGSVDEAAGMVGMRRAGAYELRRRAGAESFAAAWDRALLWAGESLLERSIRRAIHGTAVPVIRNGTVVGATRIGHDQLLMTLLARVEGRTRRRHRRAELS